MTESFTQKNKDRVESPWLARVGKDGGESPTSVYIRVGLDFLESTRDFAIFKTLGCIKKKKKTFSLSLDSLFKCPKNKDFLISKNITCDRGYIPCNTKAKTFHHLFIECKSSIILKFNVSNLVGSSIEDRMAFFLGSCDSNKVENQTLAMICVLAFTWTIWDNRTSVSSIYF